MRRAVRELAPGGVDVYFDNVGGEILDDVLTCLARGARVVICGAISQYNEDAVRGPANYMMLLVARASMTGMLVFDYADRYGEALAEMAGWYRDGRLVSREQVVHGTVADFPPRAADALRGGEHRQADPGPGWRLTSQRRARSTPRSRASMTVTARPMSGGRSAITSAYRKPSVIRTIA